MVVATIVILALLGTVAYAAVQPTNDQSLKEMKSGKRARVKVTNSLRNKAIISTRGMFPGNEVRGSVVIGNGSKKRKATLYLGLSNLVDTPPRTGVARLSYRLVLTVRQITNKRRPRVVYSGPLREMPMIKLGKFKPRMKKTYLFTVYFSERGDALDNPYQGAVTTVTFNWYARPAR